MRTPRPESLCYGQISACRGANRKNPSHNRPILRWDQLAFRWFMLDRVKLCTLETFGDSVATASFLRCKFRSFSPRFPSVIRSPPPVFSVVVMDSFSLKVWENVFRIIPDI